MASLQRLTVLALLCLVAASGCAPSHAGRTVGKGVLQVEGGVGGPFVTNLGGAIPVPNVPVGARYGLKDRMDVSAHVNLLPIFLGGFGALDGSVTFGLLRKEGHRGWNAAAGTGFIFFSDFENSARTSPVFDMAASYTFDWITPFTGADLAVDLWGGGVVATPYLGLEADMGDLTLSFSGVWHAANYDWYASPVRYVGPGYRGGLGVMLGIKYRWDLNRCSGGRS